jgi:DNA-binding PadR family transcriptional regulator
MRKTKPEMTGATASGGRRVIEGDELRLVLLLLISNEPRHGYALIGDIKSRTDGNYAPSPGVVYPILSALEEQGYIELQASKGSKRPYSLTASGRQHLEDHETEATGALARIEALRFKGSHVAAGPVGRAMQSLKTALGQCLQGTPDRQLLLSVADIIDDAVRRIERL